MPNVGQILKEEIRRLAKKEVRAVAGPLKKRVAELERSNAAWKKKVPALDKAVARLNAEAEVRQLRSIRAGEKEVKGARIGPRSIAAQRRRLKLSRKDFGTLAGVSANTIYLWETGEVSPRDKSRKSIVGLRKLGTREAHRLLEAAESPVKKTSPRKRPRKTRKKRR